MKRLLLLSLFLVLMTAEMLAIDLSLAPGLSIKNAYLYVILLALGVEAAVRKNEGRIELLGIHVPFILLIVYATFSWAVTALILGSPGYGVFENLITLKNRLFDHYLFYLVFFYGVGSTKDALWVTKYLLGIVVLANVITLLDVYNVPDLGIIHERRDGRVSGPLGEANQYAAFLILFLPGLAAVIWKATGLKLAIHIPGLLASFTVLVLTTSRGAFMGLAGGIVLGTLYLSRFIRLKQLVRITMAVGFLAVLSTVALSYKYSDLLYERFVEQTSAKDIRYVSSGRSQIWAKALSKQMEEPITFIVGYGWGAYDAMKKMGDFRYAIHNTYLEYLFNMGIIGLGLFLLLVANVIRVTRKGIYLADDSTRVLLMAFLLGFLSTLVALFFVDLHKPWLFVWAYTGLMTRVALEASAKQVLTKTGDDTRGFS